VNVYFSFGSVQRLVPLSPAYLRLIIYAIDNGLTFANGPNWRIDYPLELQVSGEGEVTLVDADPLNVSGSYWSKPLKRHVIAKMRRVVGAWERKHGLPAVDEEQWARATRQQESNGAYVPLSSYKAGAEWAARHRARHVLYE